MKVLLWYYAVGLVIGLIGLLYSYWLNDIETKLGEGKDDDFKDKIQFVKGDPYRELMFVALAAFLWPYMGYALALAVPKTIQLWWRAR